MTSPKTQNLPSYYPVFLDLTGRPCVVIGGGAVAEGKVQGLLHHNCPITLVSPTATAALKDWAAKGRIQWLQREYQPGDLKDAFLAIAATDQRSVNDAVAKEAAAEKVLLNVVDYPPLCVFIAPAVVKRGPVTFAISTSGASPALARKLRESLEQSDILPYADLAPLLMRARLEIKKQGLKVHPDRWQEALNHDLLRLVQQGHEDQAFDRLMSTLTSKSKGRAR